MGAVGREEYERLGVDPDKASINQLLLVARLAKEALHATTDLQESIRFADDEIRPPSGKVYLIRLSDYSEFSFPNPDGGWTPRDLRVPQFTFFVSDKITIVKPKHDSIAWTEVHAYDLNRSHTLTISGDSEVNIIDASEVPEGVTINQHLGQLLEENEKRLLEDDDVPY